MKFLFLYATILMSMPVSAQEVGSVTGYIRSEANQPIQGATVTLIKVSDSTVARNSLSGFDGKFLIEQVAPGSYRLQVSHIGYKLFRGAVITFSIGKSPYVAPDIVLGQAEVALGVIEIRVGKKLVEQRIDRTVINVDALIANAGVTALDVLGQSPGIQVDQNGGISLRGKSGVQIFVDDKPTYLSGNDLATYLQSLPSGTLDQIEIIPNPPAKYDAAGGAGIINIKTKRAKVKGFNGSLSLGLTQGRLTKSNNSLNFNYRADKLNISG
ncbi:MAG TPA: TonB-dependent receptor, partial [Pedobacter sp.]|nr:TonB-dependent receptor [Pedobacter sp.]